MVRWRPELTVPGVQQLEDDMGRGSTSDCKNDLTAMIISYLCPRSQWSGASTNQKKKKSRRKKAFSRTTSDRQPQQHQQQQQRLQGSGVVGEKGKTVKWGVYPPIKLWLSTLGRPTGAGSGDFFHSRTCLLLEKINTFFGRKERSSRNGRFMPDISNPPHLLGMMDTRRFGAE